RRFFDAVLQSIRRNNFLTTKIAKVTKGSDILNRKLRALRTSWSSNFVAASGRSSLHNRNQIDLDQSSSRQLRNGYRRTGGFHAAQILRVNFIHGRKDPPVF